MHQIAMCMMSRFVFHDAVIGMRPQLINAVFCQDRAASVRPYFKQQAALSPTGRTGGTTLAPSALQTRLRSIREGPSEILEAVGTREYHGNDS